MGVDLDRWAEHLIRARATCTPVQPITDTEPDLTLEEAYAIQHTVLEHALADGRRIIGAKLGLTSAAKQAQMGVDRPVFGWLTDDMELPAETPVRLDQVIHPRAEPEIVFVLGDDLVGPGVRARDVLDATAFVCCGLEIIDSRYESFRFTLPDVVADNTSASRLTLGIDRRGPDEVDLGLVGVLLEVGPELVDTAAGAACLGHPATAVAALANWLAERDRSLEAGWLVLSGGLTAAVPLSEGRPVCATFGHLGSVAVRAA